MSGWMSQWAAQRTPEESVIEGEYYEVERRPARSPHQRYNEGLEVRASDHAKRGAIWCGVAVVSFIFAAVGAWPLFFLGVWGLASWWHHRSEARLMLRVRSVPWES